MKDNKMDLRKRRIRDLKKAREARARMSYPLERRMYLNDAEVAVLYSAMEANDLTDRMMGRTKGVRDFMGVDLMIRGTLTSSQVAGLDFEHIILRNETLVCKTRGGNIQRKAIEEGLIEHIRQYIMEVNIERGPLFVRGGKRVGRQGIEAMWRRSLKKAGLRQASHRAALHTAAVNIYFQTGSLRQAARARGIPLWKARKLYAGISREEYETPYYLM
jgi:hypothetical protein